MPRSLPLLKQEHEDSCALACLRMVLAGHGTVVSEADLEADVQREAGGTEINQLKQLAQKYGLGATIH